MRKIILATIITIGSVLLLFILFIASVWLITSWNDKTLAKNLAVTSEWAEINIQPPVKPVNRFQAIYLRPVNFKVDREAKNFDIKLSDGKVVEPEIEIYDEFGNVFQLHKSGFAMSWKDDVEFTPGNNTYTELPTNRTYTRIRIRSDLPFGYERIKWIDYNPK